jgi:hypothetical protein
VLPAIERRGAIEALIVDDSGFPKKGRHSVAVSHTNIAGSSASRRTAKSRSRCRLPTTQEVGLGHFEGRGWRGFHHHATLCIAAYAPAYAGAGGLISERETIPPSGPRRAVRSAQLAVPHRYRPRGAAVATRTPRPQFDRDHAAPPRQRSRQAPVTMPVLPRIHLSAFTAAQFVTQ